MKKIKIQCIFRFFDKEKDGNTLEATSRQPKVLIMMEFLAPIEDFEIASNTYIFYFLVRIQKLKPEYLV